MNLSDVYYFFKNQPNQIMPLGFWNFILIGDNHPIVPSGDVLFLPAAVVSTKETVKVLDWKLFNMEYPPEATCWYVTEDGADQCLLTEDFLQRLMDISVPM